MDNFYQEDKDQMKELLKLYENLKNGYNQSFIEEDAFEKLISYFEEREDITQAREVVDVAIEQFPYSASLLIRKADILLTSRQYKEALEILEQAELYDSFDINIYILKTDAYLALDQQEKAVELLEDALQRFEGEEKIELLFELADVYDDYEEFDRIFDCLKVILEMDANNEEALYKICFWTDFTGRNEESITLHRKIIDEYPYNELAWFNLAAAYQGLKLYEKAIDAYLYAVVIEEKFDYAYRNLGDAYIRLRKYKEAIEALEKVNELSKPEAVIQEAIGYCYEKLKNYAQARFYYRKASHLNQDDSKLVFKIANTYYQEGQWSSCIKQLENALRMHRLQPDYNLLMGKSKGQLKQYREAIQFFSSVVSLRPRNIAAREALIKCLLEARFAEEALVQVDAAIKATNAKPVFIFYRAAVLFMFKKQKEALLYFEKGMEMAPRLLKKFVELYPSGLKNAQVIDIIARYKKNKSI